MDAQTAYELLQLIYQESIYALYPNPRRIGCPGPAVITDLAQRSAQFLEIEDDPHWRGHVLRCGPCYRFYCYERSRIGDESH